MHLVRLLLAGIVSGTVLCAQEPLYTLRVDVPLVSLEVAAFDATGRALTTLNRENFHVFEDGVLQEIKNFNTVQTPYNILLMFDRSGSTQNQWLFMQRAVARFLERLRPQDRVSIAAFDSEFDVLLDWTDQRRDAIVSLSELIRRRGTNGRTEFYSAVDRAVRRHFRNVSGRKAVVVFTDGRDTNLYFATVDRNGVPRAEQDREFARLVERVRDNQTPLYFVAVNTDRNLDLTDGGGAEYVSLRRIYPRAPVASAFLAEVRERLELLVDVSGGRIFFPQSIEDVIPLYEQMAQELGTSYSLGYIPGKVSNPQSSRRIEVRVDTAVRVWQSRSEVK